MRNLVLVSFCALFLTVIASAGIFRNAVKPTAKASAKVISGAGAYTANAVTFAANKGADGVHYTGKKLVVPAVKESAKVTSYPVRHPKKSAKKAAHAVK